MPKVLIVDDSLSVRKVVERILESRQLVVLQASLGTEAIECIQRDEPDLVVCDVLLPDREGYEVCEFVKSHPRFDHTPVLLISGIVNPAVVDRAERVGSAGVMRKPFSAEELTGKVNDLLGRAAQAKTPPARANGTARPSVRRPSRRRLRWPLHRTGSTPRAGQAAGAAAADSGSRRWPRVRPRSEPGRMPGGPRGGGGRPRGRAGRSWRPADRDGRESGRRRDARRRDRVPGLGVRRARHRASAGRGPGAHPGARRGLVLVSVLGETAVLTLVLDEPAALGKARYYVKKAVPDLLRAL